MKKVYVVSYTKWDYSEVRAVFETEEAAQTYIDERPLYARNLDFDCVPMFYAVKENENELP